MAVVVAPENVDKFLKLAERENLEASIVAEVKAEPRLIIRWNGKDIVNISREFLDTNGAEKAYDCKTPSPLTGKRIRRETSPDYIKSWRETLIYAQRGDFPKDSTPPSEPAGVLMPFGGKYQMTPVQAMVQKNTRA